MRTIDMKKIGALIMVLLLSFSLLSGCVQVKDEYIEQEDSQQGDEPENQVPQSSYYPIEVVDDFGNEVTIEKMPERIISLAPNHTEILFSLGLGDKTVGVTNYCNYPEEALSKEKIGDAFAVNVEKVIDLNPDLVLQYGSGSEEVNKSLRDADITLLSYEPESIDEVVELIMEIGRLTKTGQSAAILTARMLSKKDHYYYGAKDAEKPKVFYEVWNEPLQTAGPGSFIDELITLAGGENIAKDAKGEYPQFQLETLIERNPDVYLTAKDFEEKTPEAIKTRQGYETIKAVINDKVYVLDPDIISRPGPRITDGLELIAKILHPELFDK